MFGSDWDEGCVSCSFWADNYKSIIVHLNQRDASFATVSYAPIAKIEQYRKRMDWNFNWLSSNQSEFNFDFQVSLTEQQLADHAMDYNYQVTDFAGSEAAGISVFFKDEHGTIYHTYSCYSRGLDMLNSAYHYMDLLPKGRDEDNLSNSMQWLYRHNQYPD